MLKKIKHMSELSYWKRQFTKEKGALESGWYKDIMLLMADEKDDEFLRDKVVADFGCGPRDTLGWVQSTSHRIGLDVLSKEYLQFNISNNNTIYPVVTEDKIALPDNYVDVLFTMNALDHVKNLRNICDEISRIMKPGGILIASFNMEETATLSEPQILNEKKLSDNLLSSFSITQEKRTISANTRRSVDNFNNKAQVDLNKPYYYWVKAIKK